MDITQIFGYGFIQRAMIAGVFIALLCAILGVFLVLRRFSLIGDGLGHVTFGSIALGLLLKTYPFYVAIPIVVLSSLWILKLTEKDHLFGDAAIGIISAAGIAIGVMLASMAGGFNVDLFSYLFGNILSIGKEEVALSIGLSVLVFILIKFFYHDLLSVTFDEEYARTCGINASRINKVLIVLTALTVVLSIRIVGTMLVSSLLIFPAVTALQLAGSFRATMVISCAVALASVVLGIILSFALNLPTGASIVIINLVFFILAFVYRKML